jgi:hypothetical protein
MLHELGHRAADLLSGLSVAPGSTLCRQARLRIAQGSAFDFHVSPADDRATAE